MIHKNGWNKRPIASTEASGGAGRWGVADSSGSIGMAAVSNAPTKNPAAATTATFAPRFPPDARTINLPKVGPMAGA